MNWRIAFFHSMSSLHFNAAGRNVIMARWFFQTGFGSPWPRLLYSKNNLDGAYVQVACWKMFWDVVRSLLLSIG
jgi:hypothetical protein